MLIYLGQIAGKALNESIAPLPQYALPQQRVRLPLQHAQRTPTTMPTPSPTPLQELLVYLLNGNFSEDDIKFNKIALCQYHEKYENMP